LAAYKDSREYRDRIFPLTRVLARLDTFVFVLSLLACAAFARKGRAQEVSVFFYAAVAFLIINAAVCATLAGVYDRYQSRVAWIIPFCLALYVCRAIREKRSIFVELESADYVSAAEPL
jgi:hypothetical protein